MKPFAFAVALLLAAPAGAQTRDPMHPIVSARPAAAASAAASAAESTTPRQLLIVDGRRYVIERGQRRAVGELLGGQRIVRIDDTAVIVRTDDSSAGEQRLPLFAGVVKRPASSSGTRP